MRVGGKEGLVSDEWNDQADPGVVRGPCLIGYQVEATDGPIGRVDQHADEVRPAYIVVDTGPWIFGRRVLLPFGTVTKIDEREQKVYLDRSKEEIKDAPPFDAHVEADAAPARTERSVGGGEPMGAGWVGRSPGRTADDPSRRHPRVAHP